VRGKSKMRRTACRKFRVAGLALLFLVGLGAAAFAAPNADCNGQINIAYRSGPAFGLDGDQYEVEIGLGTGSITGGASNTLSLQTVRFNLDCAFAGLPGCIDDGNVMAFVN